MWAVGSPPSGGSRTVPTAQECHPGKSVMTKIQQYERTIALSRQVSYKRVEKREIKLYVKTVALVYSSSSLDYNALDQIFILMCM